MQGDGDSEIALVVEDQDFLETEMDGQPYIAARFAATLRRKLYRGLLASVATSHLLICVFERKVQRLSRKIAEDVGSIAPPD